MRTVLLVLALASGMLASALGCGQAGGRARPNVLFILAEDQGAHLGALGTPGLETPHIDGLAARGMLFTEAFTVYPVCSASKASLYTGRHAHVHGLRGNTANFFKPADQLTAEDRAHPYFERLRVGDTHPTLVEALREAGVRTAVTHKLHVLPNEKFPFDRYQRRTGAEDVRRLIVELGEDGAPWFAMLNLKGAHRPFRDSDTLAIGVDPAEVALPGYLPDTPAVRRDWAEYLDAIERTDAIVGAALSALRESGQAERTIVVYTSDHGPAFQRGKLSLHDLGVRVPLVFAGPGIEHGRRDDVLVSSVDLMPTLLDLLALETQTRFDGRSLAPVLRGGDDAEPRRFVFAEIDHEVEHHDDGMHERSVFDGRHRLIWRDDGRKPRSVPSDVWWWEHWRNRTYQETVNRRAEFRDAFRWLRQVDTGRLRGVAPARELYDLRADPDELVNLADSPAERPTLERLESALHAWALETGDRAMFEAAGSETPRRRAGPGS